MKTRILFLVFFFIGGNILFAQWVNNPMINTKICDTDGYQVMPKFAINTQTGTGYISWFSASEDWQFDVYMNKIDKDGNLHWGEEGILVSDNPTDTWVTDYDMIIDDENCAILMNQDMRTGYSNVFAYRISPDGNFLWGDEGLQITDNTNFNPSPCVVQDNNGDYTIAWSEDSVIITPTDTTEYDFIRFQKFNKDGNKLWNQPKTIFIDSLQLMLLNFKMIVKPDNGFYLPILGVFRPDTIEPGKYPTMNIFVQNFDANGTPLWDEMVYLEEMYYLSSDFYIYGDAYYHSDGGVVICWQSAEQFGGTIKMQHLDNSGNKLCEEWGTLVCDNPGHLFENFTSAYDANDYLYVTYEDLLYDPVNLRFCSKFGGQKLDGNGNRFWSDTGISIIPAICAVDTAQWSAGTAIHPEGGIIAVSNKAFMTIIGPDTIMDNVIYASRINDDGTYAWNNKIIPVSDTASFKLYYSLSEYTSGEWMFAWSDGRSLQMSNMGGGIYAQNIIEDGSLGPLFIHNNPMVEKNRITITPNPVSDIAEIYFELANSGFIEIQLINQAGQLVRTVISKELTKGEHTIQFLKKEIKPGTYFVKLSSEQESSYDKIVIL